MHHRCDTCRDEVARPGGPARRPGRSPQERKNVTVLAPLRHSEDACGSGSSSLPVRTQCQPSTSSSHGPPALVRAPATRTNPSALVAPPQVSPAQPTGQRDGRERRSPEGAGVRAPGAPGCIIPGVILMWALGLVLLGGVGLTAWWGGARYRPWVLDGEASATPPDRPTPRAVALRYLRGVAVALVGGFWAGALVTGPAMRLVMRLLAVTSGDRAQGRLTEAREVVGAIDLGGTLGLYVFGGILPGLISGGLYVVCRRLLPAGRLGGIAFGVLHLVLAATRIDPLRPDNPDFDVLGPGWLSVLAFGVAAVVHGMAVVALANRYSALVPPDGDRRSRARAVLPLVLPALVLVPGAAALVPIAAGLVVAVALSRVPPLVRAARRGSAVVAGRLAVLAVTVALLPGTVTGLWDITTSDGGARSAADGVPEDR